MAKIAPVKCVICEKDMSMPAIIYDKDGDGFESIAHLSCYQASQQERAADAVFMSAMIEAVEKDNWCQECGLHETEKFLLEWLPKCGIEIPEWVIERTAQDAK